MTPPQSDHHDDEQMGQVWVRTGQTAFGVYTCEINYTPDHALILLPDQVHAYAQALLRALVCAEYDAAIVKQFNNGARLGIESAAFAVLELRKSRPEINHAALGPLVVEPIVTSRTKMPELNVTLKGTRTSWAWKPAEVVAHIQQVHEASLVADLDAKYRAFLIGTVGLGADEAERAVADLGNFWPERGTPRP